MTQFYKVSGSSAIREIVTRSGDIVQSKVALDDGMVDGLDECSIFDLMWLKSTRRPRTPGNRGVVRIVDLFAGCGGLSVGVSEACRALGLTPAIVLANDLDGKILEVFGRNFPEAELVAAPIEQLLDSRCGSAYSSIEKDLRKRVGKVDLLIGGPPCQGHSDLNNHTRRSDPKNDLYVKMARFCEIVRPRHVVIENVPGVLHDKSQVAQRTWAILEKLGYSVDSGVFNAVDVGVAQNRKRSITLASLDIDPSVSAAIKESEVPIRSIRWAIGNLRGTRGSKEIFETAPKPSDENRRRINYLFENGLFDLPDEERPDCHRLKEHTYKSVYGRLRWNRPAPTITTGFGSAGRGRNVHPSQRRTITPHEAARIQFFPDFFNFGPMGRVLMHKVIGNAVPTKMGYALGLHILR